MSYSIIFETKIVKLDNGDIIHFDRSGCNNDNAGRRQDDYTAKLYSPAEWEAYIQKFETEYGSNDPDAWDMKIGSRCVKCADYGKHLRTMTKRATTLEELRKTRSLSETVFDGITFYPDDGESEFIPASDGKRIDDVFYGTLYGRIKGGYTRKTRRLFNPDEIEASIRQKEHATFFMSKKRR